MRIDNQFTVPATQQRAWEFLTDLEQVAPCLPGATVESVEGETLQGRVALRIGPMNMSYAGEARFVVKDDESFVATIEAGGRDSRGGGAVKAKIRASLSEASDGTQVNLSTDLSLTGRVAQLGQGPVNDLSAKLLGQFADCLAAKIDQVPTAVRGAPDAEAPAQEAEPINLLDASLMPRKAVIGAGAAAGLLALLIAVLLGRRFGRKGAR